MLNTGLPFALPRCSDCYYRKYMLNMSVLIRVLWLCVKQMAPHPFLDHTLKATDGLNMGSVYTRV